MSGLYPPTPSPRSGARGRKRVGVTQIHWDFESCVLRNVGKDEAASLCFLDCYRLAACATRNRIRNLLVPKDCASFNEQCLAIRKIRKEKIRC